MPNRLLESWATIRTLRGVLTGNKIAEIGQLSDVQLDSPAVAATAPAFHGLKEWALAVKPV